MNGNVRNREVKFIVHLVMASALATGMAGLSCANPTDDEDGHFSSWNEVPAIIDSIDKNSYQKQLKQLHQLTRVKLGYQQSSVCLNDEEHQQYMLQTKQRWKQWWKSTGEPVNELKERLAKVDQPSFRMAWEFLGTKKEQPKKILPVWIPKTWTLYVTYNNGDYRGKETEVWIIDRQASSASMTKLRGEYGKAA